MAKSEEEGRGDVAGTQSVAPPAVAAEEWTQPAKTTTSATTSAPASGVPADDSDKKEKAKPTDGAAKANKPKTTLHDFFGNAGTGAKKAKGAPSKKASKPEASTKRPMLLQQMPAGTIGDKQGKGGTSQSICVLVVCVFAHPF